MGKFCGHCGADLIDTDESCGACGTRQLAPTTPQQPQTSNTVAKLVVGLVGLVCVCGVLALARTIYLTHKASAKARDLTRQVTGKNSDSASGGLASGDDNGVKGDPCRFLSKEDVSHAAGVTIIRADAKDGACLYVARGDPAEMTSKHMAAMVGSQAASRGDKVTQLQQQMMQQQITGAFFKEQEESDKNLSAEAAKGEVVVLGVSFDFKAAKVAMRLTKAAFDRIKENSPLGAREGSTAETATGELTGLGDEAYEMGGSMLMVRKGDTMARFMFNECPCSADAIRPLAEKVVSQL